MIRVSIFWLLIMSSTTSFAQNALQEEAGKARKTFDLPPAKSTIILPTKFEKKEEDLVELTPLATSTKSKARSKSKSAKKSKNKEKVAATKEIKGPSRAAIEKVIASYFYKGSLEKLEEEAREMNKPYFIDFYTDWCAPCKQMDKETFVHPEVMSFIKKNYLAYKLNGEKKEAGVAKLNKVKAYPTIIFFDKDSHEIGRIESYLGTQAFLSRLKKHKPRVPNTRYSEFR